eukprot:5993307-Lingulodinium_polyedra.AAC.1
MAPDRSTVDLAAPSNDDDTVPGCEAPNRPWTRRRLGIPLLPVGPNAGFWARISARCLGRCRRCRLLL